jgi:hypothetical protein
LNKNYLELFIETLTPTLSLKGRGGKPPTSSSFGRHPQGDRQNEGKNNSFSPLGEKVRMRGN